MRVPTSVNATRKFGYTSSEFEATLVKEFPMQIQVESGVSWINDVFVDFRQTKSTAFVAPVSGVKLDVLCLKQNATLEIVLGVPAANNPVVPAIPLGMMPLHIVVNRAGTLSLTQDMIMDARSIYNFFVMPDPDLSNYALTEDVDQLEGTTSKSFTIGSGLTGVPIENCQLDFDRGSLGIAGFRFNETLDRLEYSNDGTTWIAIGNAIIPAATTSTTGAVVLSAAPTAGSESAPVVVSDSDTRLFSNGQKSSVLAHITHTIPNITSATKLAGDTGVKGDMAYDTGFLYVCVATDTWVKIALTPWI